MQHTHMIKQDLSSRHLVDDFFSKLNREVQVKKMLKFYINYAKADI